ncbi:MAG: hypothetical protein AB7E27_02760, partial [Candidatus Methanomethylophilaceae archaeon]
MHAIVPAGPSCIRHHLRSRDIEGIEVPLHVIDIGDSLSDIIVEIRFGSASVPVLPTPSPVILSKTRSPHQTAPPFSHLTYPFHR